MAKIVVLDGTLAYGIDIAGISNALTGGRYLKTADSILSGYDPGVHTLAVVTGAAECAALEVVVAVGGFAVWPLYSKTGEAPEIQDGYLKITHTDGLIASVSAAGALGTEELTVAAFTDRALALVSMKTYTDTADLVSALSVAKAAVRIAD